jgi:DNA-binding HxlR family transcriptional regulator
VTSPIPDAEFDVFSSNCPSREVLQHLTGRWGALVLAALADGPQRFSGLRRRVDGISDRLLSQTLQHLEADKMVLRDDRRTTPPHVEYSLTDHGRRVTPKLIDLITTLEALMPEIVERQPTG